MLPSPSAEATKCYYKSSKPWVSSVMKKSIHRKNSLYRSYLKSKTHIKLEEVYNCTQ